MFQRLRTLLFLSLLLLVQGSVLSQSDTESLKRLKILIEEPSLSHGEIYYHAIQSGASGLELITGLLRSDSYQHFSKGVSILSGSFRYNRTGEGQLFVQGLLPTCIDILEKGTPARRAKLAHHCANLEAWGEPLIPSLIRLVEDPDALPEGFKAGRRSAVRALGMIRSRPDTCLPVLEKALKDPQLTEPALKAVGRFEREALPLLPTLENYVSFSGNPAIMQAAEDAIARLKLPPMPEAGRMAPPFSIESLADGNTITLEGMKGKWVYLDFWATTCPPCHPSLDSLNAVFGRNKESWRGQLEVIAVSIDASKGTAMRRIKERRWNQIRHAWTSSEGTMAQAYRIGAIPHGILIAPDGRVAWTGNPYGKDLERFFTDHLYAKK